MDIDPSNHPHNQEDLFEDLHYAESNFYEEGYKAGHDHGKLHGLFEGRELGREKGWEIWEEVGFYSGWARLHLNLLEKKGVVPGGRGKESRAMGHAKVLQELIDTFPMTNPSETAKTVIPTSTDDETTTSDSSFNKDIGIDIQEGQEKEVDMATLISTIRARYRLLCTSLNVRPRLNTAANAQGTDGVEGGVQSGVVEGIEGPMKGVDTRQLRF